MKAIIIARVSTEEQKEAGLSLPAQVTRLENYCQNKGFSVIKSFSFDESAYKDDRSAFDVIFNFIIEQKEKVAICCDKVDRLTRNMFDKRVSFLYDKALRDEIELHFEPERPGAGECSANRYRVRRPGMGGEIRPTTR
jgi:DNA invertase Pin-like site-specific DNA recombinase